MRVDIWSDVICPWCYIGKRRFAEALASSGRAADVEVVYRAFELDPAYPKDDHTPVRDVIAVKYGMSEAKADQAEAEMAERARSVGLAFNPDRVMGNTFDAHRLIQLASERGVQDQAVERLFRAYFSEGRPVFDQADLTALAADSGLDPAEAAAVLADGRYAEAVRADEQQAAELGISGVPFFVLDGRYAVSGAHPVATFSLALERAFTE